MYHHTVVPIQSYQYSCTYVPTILGMWDQRTDGNPPRIYLSLSSGCHCATCCLAGHQPWEAQWGGNTHACQRGEVTRELHAYPCRTIGLCLSTQSRLRHGRLLVAVVYDGPRNRNCPRDSLHRVCETDDVPMFLSPECRKIYSFTKRPLH